MNQNNYENNLRSKFESYAPSVDESALWAEIESALPKKKNRKYFFFFAIAGSLILTLAITYALLDRQTERTTVSENYSMKDNYEDKEAVVEQTTAQNTVESQIRPGKATTGMFEEAITRNDSRAYNSGRITKPALFAPTLSETIPSYSSNQEINTSVVRRKIANRATSQMVLETTSNGVVGVKTITKTSGDRILHSPVTALDIIVPHLFSDERTFDLNWDVVDFPEISVPRRSPWSLDVALSGGLTQSVYSMMTPDGASLVNLREGLERNLETLGANISIQYRLADHWTFGLGLSYLTQVVSSEVVTTTTAIMSREDTTAIFHTSEGMIIETGPREFLETTMSTHLRYQRSQQLLLPISVKYSGTIEGAWGINWA